MLSIRQRAATAVRRTKTTKFQNKRSYASEAPKTEPAAPGAGEESFGLSFYMFLGAGPAVALLYALSRPGENGEPHSLTKYLTKVGDFRKTWEERNARNTDLIEQAARDRHLFNHAPRNEWVDLKMPELLGTGSQMNVPAGHGANLERAYAHFRERAQQEEQRVARKMQEASKSS